MLRRLIITAVVVCLGFVSTARAGLLPVSVSVIPEADKYRFTYSILLPTDAQLRSGDFFTIYDFAGYQNDSAVYSPSPDLPSNPTDWTVSVSNLGTTPAMLGPDDSPDQPNLTWTYHGPTINTGATGLGNFWAVSLYGETTAGPFTARTHRTADGKIDSNITDTTVPVPSPPAPSVPEPATLLLAGLAFPLVALRRRLGSRS